MNKKIKNILLLGIVALSFLSLHVNAAYPIQSATGGAWYNPDEDGHGFILNVSKLPEGQLTLLATWYTYDNQGNQMWLIGSAPFENGADSVSVPVIVTSGFSFGAPADVSQQDWGILTFEFSSCTAGSVQYVPNDSAFIAGTVQIERLTNTAGHKNCSDDVSGQVPGGDNNPGGNTVGGFEKGIEIISISSKPVQKRRVTACDVQVEVRNHNSKGVSLVMLSIDAFSGSDKLGKAIAIVKNIPVNGTGIVEGTVISGNFSIENINNVFPTCASIERFGNPVITTVILERDISASVVR
ncbi:MAG: hypothetical protein V3V18_01015 [Methylococcales bacterium]